MTSFSVVRYLTFVMLYALCRAEFSVRTTNYGSVKGTVSTSGHNKKIEKFFGIPYARPPVGELRLEVSGFSCLEIFRLNARTLFIDEIIIIIL